MRDASVVLLPASPASVAVARRMLCAELRAARVTETATRDAALVISELLSNAILHAYPLPGERLQVAWALRAGTIEIAVSDGGSHTEPKAALPPSAAPGGRGLGIVECLAERWGVRQESAGITVWAVLAAPAKRARPIRKPVPRPIPLPG